MIGGWAAKGALLRECRKKNVKGLPADGKIFTENIDRAEREDLTVDIVSDGIIYFTAKSMRGGGWKPTGRATMKTYFIGACLFAAAKPLKELVQKIDEDRRRVEYEQIVAKHYLDNEEPVDLLLSPGDLANDVVRRLQGEELMRRLSPEEQKIIRLKGEGYTYKEIGRATGSTTKGVESRMQRIRRESQERKGRTG